MKSNFLGISFLFFLLFSFKSSKVVILPFKDSYSFNPENTLHKEYTPTLFLQEKFINNIYTEIKMGKPDSTLISYFTSENKYFQITTHEKSQVLIDQEKEMKESNQNFNHKKEKIYDPISSNSFQNITKSYNNRQYYGYSLINETINLCTDLPCKKTVKLENFQLYAKDGIGIVSEDEDLEEIKKVELIGKIGLQLTDKDRTNGLVFTNQLLERGLIDSFEFTIVYTSPKDGYLYIGEFPHDFDPKKYQSSHKKNVRITPYQSYLSKFHLEMDYVRIRENNDKEKKSKVNDGKDLATLSEKNVFFSFELGLILGTEQYLLIIDSLFFGDRYKKDVCTKNSIYLDHKNYYLITCYDDNPDFPLNLESFPSLFFDNIGLDYSFELSYKDLFKKIDDTYYFLIVFDTMGNKLWKLGKPFLMKYPVTINSYDETLSFYDILNTPMKRKENVSRNSKIKLIITILAVILSVVLIVYAYFLGKRSAGINRKRRTNELEDEYEYRSNKIEKIGKEMPKELYNES